MDNPSIPRFDAGVLRQHLAALGDHLAAVGSKASIVVVGGAALSLRGWIPRATQDVDVIALVDAGELVEPEFSPEMRSAIRRVARDFAIPGDWLNAAVAMQWRGGLPPWLLEEIQWLEFGVLRVGLAGRRALLALKLFAAVDGGPRSVHCQDLIALGPSDEELAMVRDWVLTQDAAAEWPGLVAEVIAHVKVRRLP